MALVLRCSDALAPSEVANYLTGGLPLPLRLIEHLPLHAGATGTISLDLSNVTKLGATVFFCEEPTVQFVIAALHTEETKHPQASSLALSRHTILTGLIMQPRSTRNLLTSIRSGRYTPGFTAASFKVDAQVSGWIGGRICRAVRASLFLVEES